MNCKQNSQGEHGSAPTYGRRDNSPRKQEILIGADRLVELGIPYCGESLRRLERDGLFPKRVPLSAVRIAWVESEVLEWITEKIQGRSSTSTTELETQNDRQ